MIARKTIKVDDETFGLIEQQVMGRETMGRCVSRLIHEAIDTRAYRRRRARRTNKQAPLPLATGGGG